jgi:hypothetical protein
MLKTVTTATAVAVVMATSPVLALKAPPLLQLVQPAPAAGESETRGTSDETVAAEPRTFLEQQEETTVLASALLGATVYDTADQGLGSVRDLVFAEDGSIDAVVIGVGGFLGIGEKNVAVSMVAFDRANDPDGNVKLVLDATAEELEAAPPFVTLAELRRQQEMNTQPPPGPAGIAPAPVPAM